MGVSKLLALFALSAGSVLPATASPAVPSQPQHVNAQPGRFPGEIWLSWERPITDGGTPISGYVIYQAVEDAETFTRVGDAPAYATTTFLAGRTPLLRHRLRVTAVNASGESLPSEAACTRPFPWSYALACGPYPPEPPGVPDLP